VRDFQSVYYDRRIFLLFDFVFGVLDGWERFAEGGRYGFGMGIGAVSPRAEAARIESTGQTGDGRLPGTAISLALNAIHHYF
jgi:hypothetical protein